MLVVKAKIKEVTQGYNVAADFADELENYTLVDPDVEKQNHPEYDPNHPEILHQWSKERANQKRLQAMSNGDNLIIDGTGTNAEKMVKYINDLQALGYEVTLLFVSVTLKTSLKRNAQRERTVPEHIVREKAEVITTSFEIVSRYADKVRVIDNN